MQKCLQFLDYVASQEDTIATYQASNMRLAIHSNWMYLSEPKAHSRTGGHMLMAGTEDIPINNGAVLNILQIIRAVMFGCQGRIRRIVHQHQNSGINAAHTQGNGTFANLHPHLNQQFDCSRTNPQQSSAQAPRRWRPWTCNSTGCIAAKGRTSIDFTGDLKHIIWQITGPNIIQPATTNLFLATNSNICHYWSQENIMKYSKDFCNQVLCQEYSIDTIICGTINSKTKNNCSQRWLIAQWQGCVRRAVRTSTCD